MSEQTDKITIKESNLSIATKKDYDFRLGLFYCFSPIKSDDELIDCPSNELQKFQYYFVTCIVLIQKEPQIISCTKFNHI